MKARATIVVTGLIAAVSLVQAAHVQVENLPTRAWGGSTVRPVFRVTGVAEGVALRLVWGLAFGETAAAGGGVLDIKGPGTTEVTIQLPDVLARVRLSLEVYLIAAQEVLAQTKCSLDLFPPDILDALKDVYRDRPVGIVEVGEGAKSRLETVDIEWKQLRSAAQVRHFDGSLVILDADRPLSRWSSLAAALLDRVEEGMNVVCVGKAPGALPLGDVPARQRRAGAGEVRVLAPQHPLLADLQRADLKSWGGDGVVAQALPPIPHGGNYLMVLDLPSDTGPLPVATEIRHGAGRILCCGLAVAEKLREEPVAALVFANMLRWGFGSAPPLQDPRGCFAKESSVEKVLTGLGVRFRFSPAKKGGILIGDEALLEEKRRTLLANQLAQGGTVILFYLTPSGLDALNDMLEKRWERGPRGEVPRLALEKAKTGPEVKQRRPADHPLLAGVRPEDLEELMSWDEREEVLAVRAVADPAHFRHLIGKGGVAKFERDGLRVIVWQLPLKGENEDAQGRVLSAFLTNLGVRL